MHVFFLLTNLCLTCLSVVCVVVSWRRVSVLTSLKTRNREAILSARTIIWNGPSGVFEFEKFAGADRTLENTFRSIGPTASIAINTRERMEVSLSGWYERQTQTGQPDRGVTTMAMLVNIRI